MRFSELSKTEARAILAAAADPAYRDMNQCELARSGGQPQKTPEENLEEFLVWLRVLVGLGMTFEPDLQATQADISLL